MVELEKELQELKAEMGPQPGEEGYSSIYKGPGEWADKGSEDPDDWEGRREWHQDGKGRNVEYIRVMYKGRLEWKQA